MRWARCLEVVKMQLKAVIDTCLNWAIKEVVGDDACQAPGGGHRSWTTPRLGRTVARDTVVEEGAGDDARLAAAIGLQATMGAAPIGGAEGRSLLPGMRAHTLWVTRAVRVSPPSPCPTPALTFTWKPTCSLASRAGAVTSAHSVRHMIPTVHN